MLVTSSVIIIVDGTITITVFVTVIAIIIVAVIVIPTVYRNAEVVPLKGRIEAQMAGPRHVLLLHHLQVR